LLEAALIAAYFSKAQNSASVDVDYTKVRNVRKPNGAKPGFVTYDGQKTLTVTPDESIVNKLKKTKQNGWFFRFIRFVFPIRYREKYT